MRSPTKTTRGDEAAQDPAAEAAEQVPEPGDPGVFTVAGEAEETAAAPPRRKLSRGSLKNWRVRSRLLLLIVIPTVSAVALGGITIASSVRSALAYQRVETLATAGQRIVVLAQALEDERDQTAFYTALTPGGRADALAGRTAQAAPALSVVHQDYLVTDRAAAAARSLINQINGSYPQQARQAAVAALSALNSLKPLRTVATSTRLPVLSVVSQYSSVINTVLALNDQIAQVASDPALAQTVRALGLVTAMQEAASQQRALIAAALLQGGFAPGQLAAVQSAAATQQSDLSSFNASASVPQQQLWQTSQNKSYVYQASADQQQAITLAQSGKSLRSDPTMPVDWYGAMSGSVDQQMGAVARDLAAQTAARARVLRDSAIRTAALIGAAVILVLIGALVLTTIVGRSMVRPLRTLRTGALEVAGVRLPETVRRMSESDASAAALDIEPIPIDSQDEIGEVARAFDQVHREALRLAANEASLRGNVNAMFVNLSRRSQSLIERQIRLIDNLEQSEQDPERLGSLFQMDHLATRMRRNSENLLVLAGHDMARRWNQPVALVDVLRAAVSEIEQYERVSLNVQPGISARGQAVNDVVHLTAELVENATSFSPADSPVTIVGHLLGSGGVLLEITDQGVGMGAEEMAHANWRLDNPPVVDVAVSRRMGLFVVARLAARHGIRVRLRPAPSGGLTALVWLPDEVIMHDGQSAGPGDRRPEAAAAAVAPVFGDWDSSARSAAEHEVSAARTPRFTPLRPDAAQSSDSAEASGLGRRVPGSGPRPGTGTPGNGTGSWSSTGSWSGSTGPLPVFRTSPQPAPRPEPETPPREPMNGDAGPGQAPTSLPWATGPGPAFGSDAADDDATGQVPVVSADQLPPAASGPAARGPAGLPKREASRDGPAQGESDERMVGPASDLWSRPQQPASPAAGSALPTRGSNGGTPASPAAGDSNGEGNGGGRPAPPRFAARFTGFGGAGGAGGEVGGFASPAGSAPSFGSEQPGDSEPAAEAPGADDAEQAPVGVAGSGSGSGASGSQPPLAGNGHRSDPTAESSLDSVVIPPAAGLSEQNRLPIFEQVESDWFRRGRPSVIRPSAQPAPSAEPAGADAGTGPAEPSSAPAEAEVPAASASAVSSDWSSPADAGWRAAEAVSEPASAGTTAAGLPKRVPRANLVPGAVGTDSPAAAPAPARSAAVTRERLASFQRGIRQARAVGPEKTGEPSPSDEDSSEL
ncbi:MAG: nitrate- and nitrite sensing domain-containing protein [Streptosporangiaceae bacterium]